MVLVLLPLLLLATPAPAGATSRIAGPHHDTPAPAGVTSPIALLQNRHRRAAQLRPQPQLRAAQQTTLRSGSSLRQPPHHRRHMNDGAGDGPWDQGWEPDSDPPRRAWVVTDGLGLLAGLSGGEESGPEERGVPGRVWPRTQHAASRQEQQ